MGNYYVVDLDTTSTHPIVSPSDPPTTAYATWAPIGDAIAFVQDNDLYVLDTPTYAFALHTPWILDVKVVIN